MKNSGENIKNKDMKKYINCLRDKEIETVDEFPYNTKEERTEAKRCLGEYKICDPSGYYYLSQRCTKDWKNK